MKENRENKLEIIQKKCITDTEYTEALKNVTKFIEHNPVNDFDKDIDLANIIPNTELEKAKQTINALKIELNLTKINQLFIQNFTTHLNEALFFKSLQYENIKEKLLNANKNNEKNKAQLMKYQQAFIDMQNNTAIVLQYCNENQNKKSEPIRITDPREIIKIVDGHLYESEKKEHNKLKDRYSDLESKLYHLEKEHDEFHDFCSKLDTEHKVLQQKYTILNESYEKLQQTQKKLQLPMKNKNIHNNIESQPQGMDEQKFDDLQNALSDIYTTISLFTPLNATSLVEYSKKPLSSIIFIQENFYIVKKKLIALSIMLKPIVINKHPNEHQALNPPFVQNLQDRLSSFSYKINETIGLKILTPYIDVKIDHAYTQEENQSLQKLDEDFAIFYNKKRRQGHKELTTNDHSISEILHLFNKEKCYFLKGLIRSLQSSVLQYNILLREDKKDKKSKQENEDGEISPDKKVKKD